jgi:hypothetical protein
MLGTEPAFLKALIRTIPDLVWMKNPAGVFLACNPAAAKFFGAPESEVVGKTDFDFLPAEEAELYQARDREAAASDDPVTHREWLIFRGDGRRALLETIKTAMRDTSGRLVGVLGIARDITSADTAEKLLLGRLAEQERLARIAATLPGAIFAYRLRPNGTTCVPYVSSAFEELWGLRPEELVEDAAELWNTVHPDDAAGIRAQLAESTGSLSSWHGEFRVRHPRKGDVWLEVRSTPVREPDGSLLFHGFLADIGDRKRMEEALRTREAQLHEAQRLAGIGSWVWDLETNKIEWSEALYLLAGYDPASPPPRYEDLREIHTPESWERLQTAVAQARESGIPYELDLEMTLPDGRRVWRTARGEAERDASGRMVRLRGTSQNITDRKLAEQEMRAANAELAVIHAHAPVVFLVVDEDLRVEKVNETAAKLAGRPEIEMLGQRHGAAIGCLNSLADPRGCGYGPACGECAIRQAVLDTVQNRNRHDDIEAWLPLGTDGRSEPRCLLVFTAPLETRGQRKALVSVLDITSRKQTEEALRTSEARFRMLTEDAPIAISMSRQGRLVYANPTYLRMFGFESAEELRDCPLIERFAPQCRDEVTLLARERAQGLPVPREYETICQRADGSEFPALVAVITMQFAEGPALVAFITDLTGPKQAEEERLLLEQEYRQAQKLESIGRLAGGVAHDFNNLLTVINGYSRMLLDKVDARDPLRESLEEISRAGDRAAQLTQQLLAFSRKQVLKPKVLNLNRVVSEMRPMLARLLGEDVQLCVDLTADSAIICADQYQLEQVVMNLAVNSRDAMPNGGRLSIETAVVEWGESQARSYPGAPAGWYVMLAVSDTGEGMTEEARRHLFEPFFTTKEVGKGTGLGLSMVQGIVAQSGGQIEALTEFGLGTTFRIYLPKVEAVPGESSEPEIHPVVGGTATVLVVEDQEEVRKYAAAALKAYGYRVLQAESAGEALLFCERASEPIDLVLTDVVMPRLSGGELAARLKERWPGIKVLFMSGYAEDAIARHGVLEPDAVLIQKPFSPDQLAGKVREVMMASQHTARILVADDEAGVRAFLRAVLEGDGYEVTEAANGKEALQEVRAGGVDLVITDLVMPEKEGIETIRTLRQKVPGMGIIAISGAFGGQILGIARMLGANVVLAKPVSAEVLLASVAEVLNRRKTT